MLLASVVLVLAANQCLCFSLAEFLVDYDTLNSYIHALMYQGDGIISGKLDELRKMGRGLSSDAKMFSDQGEMLFESVLDKIGTMSKDWTSTFDNFGTKGENSVWILARTVLALGNIADAHATSLSGSFGDFIKLLADLPLTDFTDQTLLRLENSIDNALLDLDAFMKNSVNTTVVKGLDKLCSSLRTLSSDLQNDTINNVMDLADRLNLFTQDLLGSFIREDVVWRTKVAMDFIGEEYRKACQKIEVIFRMIPVAIALFFLVIIFKFNPHRYHGYILSVLTVILISWAVYPLYWDYFEETKICPRPRLLSYVNNATERLEIRKDVTALLPSNGRVYSLSEMGELHSGKSATLNMLAMALIPDHICDACDFDGFESRNSFEKDMNKGHTQGVWILLIPVSLAMEKIRRGEMSSGLKKVVEKMDSDGTIMLIDTEGTESATEDDDTSIGSDEMQNVFASMISSHVVFTVKSALYRKKEMLPLSKRLHMIEEAHTQNDLYRRCTLELGVSEDERKDEEEKEDRSSQNEVDRRSISGSSIPLSVRFIPTKCDYLNGEVDGLILEKSDEQKCRISGFDQSFKSMYVPFNSEKIKKEFIFKDLIRKHVDGSLVLFQPPVIGWEKLDDIRSIRPDLRKVQYATNPLEDLKEWGVSFTVFHYYGPHVLESMGYHYFDTTEVDFEKMIHTIANVLNRFDSDYWKQDTVREINNFLLKKVKGLLEEWIAKETNIDSKESMVVSAPFGQMIEEGSDGTVTCGNTKETMCSESRLLEKLEEKINDLDVELCMIKSRMFFNGKEGEKFLKRVEEARQAAIENVKKTSLLAQKDTCHFEYFAEDWILNDKKKDAEAPDICFGFCPGMKHRNVYCTPKWRRERNSNGERVSVRDECCEIDDPNMKKMKSEEPCGYWPRKKHKWTEPLFEKCSQKKCGIQKRTPECICNDQPRSDDECSPFDKPPIEQECHIKYEWKVTEWVPGDETCACEKGRLQKRERYCFECLGVEGREVPFEPSVCTRKALNNPHLEQECAIGAQWKEFKYRTKCSLEQCGVNHLEQGCFTCDGRPLTEDKCIKARGPKPKDAEEVCNVVYDWTLSKGSCDCGNMNCPYDCTACPGTRHSKKAKNSQCHGVPFPVTCDSEDTYTWEGWHHDNRRGHNQKFCWDQSRHLGQRKDWCDGKGGVLKFIRWTHNKSKSGGWNRGRYTKCRVQALLRCYYGVNRGY